MSEEKSFESYFDSAMRIHAICSDFGLSENEARLLTYMHTKSVESGKGIEYFLNPAPEDSEALEIMLGEKKGVLNIPPIMSLDDESREAIDLILTIADKIAQLDTVLASECGLENRLTSELRFRLRLYKEREFRDKMIQIYKGTILTNLSSYDSEKVQDAFKKFRTEKERQDHEIDSMTGMPKEDE